MVMVGVEPSGDLRFEVRQEVGDGRIELEPAGFDHRHGGGGDDGLGDRSEAEDRVVLHLAAGFAVGEAVGLEVGELSILHHGNDGADDALLIDGGLDGGVDAVGDVCHAGTMAPWLGLSRADMRARSLSRCGRGGVMGV